MSDILHRSHPSDLSIRSTGDGRTVYGVVAPFNTPADIVERGVAYTEVLLPGSFGRTIAERGQRVPLLVNHRRLDAPLGRAVSLREDPVGLVGEFKVSKTVAGDEALELVRDGALDAFSVGFIPRIPAPGSERSGTTVERAEVKLMEASLTAFAAYDTALVGGVRAIDLNDLTVIAAPDQGDTTTPDQGDPSAPDQGADLFRISAAARLRRLQLEGITPHVAHQ